jgi:hypothetical protein
LSKKTCSSNDYQCQQDNLLSCGDSFYSPAEKASIMKNVQQFKENNISLDSYNWFLLNPFKISKTIKFIKNLNDTAKRLRSIAKNSLRESLHGQGIGLKGSAYIVEGRELTLEAIIFNNELSLFCAPGMSYVSDVGVDLGIVRSMALGCNERSDYRGQFVSLGAGVSFTNFLLPVGVDLSYSFGFDSNTFEREVKKSIINTSELTRELAFLINGLNQFFYNNDYKASEKKSLTLGLQIALKTLQIKGVDLQDEISNSSFNLQGLTRNNSLGKVLKEVLRSSAFQEFLEQYRLANLKKILSALEKSFSGCDAISGGVSINFSAAPVNISVATTMFKDIFSIDLERVFSMKSISSFMLLNPILMDRYTLSKVIEIAVLLDKFPEILGSKCYNSNYDRMIEQLSLTNHLIVK